MFSTTQIIALFLKDVYTNIELEYFSFNFSTTFKVIIACIVNDMVYNYDNNVVPM